MKRFKIDYYNSNYAPFALYTREYSLWGEKWTIIDRFETIEKAKEFYEKIRDLPQYLD